MRRARFHSWTRKHLLELSGMDKFSLRKVAAYAQGEKSTPEFRATLMLYAHENDCVERLMSLIYDEELREEYRSVEERIGARKLERLALRGTPMMVLSQPYRDVMAAFLEAYETPERNAAEKRALCDLSRRAMLEAGISPAEIADALNLNRPNTYAYLSSGDEKRFTVETARQIADYLHVER